jgi:hypothetical protein
VKRSSDLMKIMDVKGSAGRNEPVDPLVPITLRWSRPFFSRLTFIVFFNKVYPPISRLVILGKHI